MSNSPKSGFSRSLNASHSTPPRALLIPGVKPAKIIVVKGLRLGDAKA
jgi:hypothetical protein